MRSYWATLRLAARMPPLQEFSDNPTTLKQMSPNTPNIIIVGGSLGGLSTALFLREIGCTVTVYERSPVPLVGLGAGIVLNPATVRYFTQHGTPNIAQISVAAHYLRYLDTAGQVIAERGFQYRFSSYNAIYAALLDSFGMDHYHLGQTVRSFVQDATGVNVQLDNGSSARCDLLICADGLRSAGRKQVLPTSQLAYAGYVAWRGIVDVDQIEANVLATLGEAICYHVMEQSHLLTYPIPVVEQSGKIRTHINWLWYRNVPEGSQLKQLMTDKEGAVRDVSVGPGAVASANIADLRLAAEHKLPPILANLVKQTAQPFLQAIVDCAVPQMAFGRVCLIGDAAFVARPHAAAGTAKAVEDGWQLSQALQTSSGDVIQALQVWEPKQLALGQTVLERTRRAGQRAQVESSWQVGEPLPFGLYEVGDSVMA